MADRVTAQEVADQAGVSRSAVYNWSSRPHLNSKHINAIIGKAASELEYSPKVPKRDEDRLRVGIEIHRTPEDISSGIYAPLLVALMGEVEDRGGHVVPFLTRGDPAQRREAYESTWNRGNVDGFVVDTIPPDGGEPLTTLGRLQAPFVLFGRPPQVLPVDSNRGESPVFGWVDVNNRQGMRVAVDHLLGYGHRHIAYLGPSPTVDHVSKARWLGYEEAMRLAGHQPHLEEASYDETLSTLRPRLETLLNKDVTAVAAFSDDLALELMRFAMSTGRGIGSDIAQGQLAIVGYDNSVKALLGLSSVRQPVEEISRHLVIALLEVIRRRGLPHHIELDCDLVERESTRFSPTPKPQA